MAFDDIAAGQTTIGVSFQRATGTGTFVRDGAADNASQLFLDDVGK